MAFVNLIKHEEIFDIEVQIMSYVKCALLRNEELDDFYINGNTVSVYHTSNGYELYFDDYKIDVDVYDKQIIDFKVSSLYLR